MSRSEAALWGYIRPKLVRYGDLERVENIVGYGTPDVNYCLTYRGVTGEGWIELKELEKWPARDTDVFRVDHYTQQQRLWHMKRWTRGGGVFVVLRIKKTSEILVIPGLAASRSLGKVSRVELLPLAANSVGAAFPSPLQLEWLTTLRAQPASPADSRTSQPLPG